MEDAPIVRLIHRYFPDWEPPVHPLRGMWASCKCPFHGDESPSASISYEYNAFHCFVCDAGGDMIKIIRKREEVSFGEAKRIAESLLDGGDGQVPEKPARKSRRRVFGEQRSSDLEPGSSRGDRQVHARVRRRPFGRS